MTKTPVILLVEDERPLLSAIQAKLELNGLDSVSARTVKQAIDYLETLPVVDLIWLDHYLLGKEDGIDFVARVKNEEKWRHIPIFVVSNTATAEKKHTYINLGVNKYYVKSDHRLDGIVKDVKELLENKSHD